MTMFNINAIKTSLKSNQGFIAFFILMCCFRSAIADWYIVPTGSMYPTIMKGDQITVNKMAYDLRVPFTNISLMRTNEPNHGDIMVFESKAADMRLIKRVIGLPGDVVAMKNNVVYLNGKPLGYQLIENTEQATLLSESLPSMVHITRIEKNKPSELVSFDPVTVPNDQYLVLGDNRMNSADSRVYGFVPRGELKGKAQHVAFSRNYENYNIPRAERWFKSLY